MTKTFEAQIGDFIDLTFEQITEIHQEATFDMMEEMQTPKAQGGRMPVDTGFLRNSLVSGLNGAFGEPSAASFELVSNLMNLDDVARFAYTAQYAPSMEFGRTGESEDGSPQRIGGNLYMTTAASNWAGRVEAYAAKIS